MKYPLGLSFKFWAFAPQIFVRDSEGNEVIYVHQKLFKLREKVNVYRDRTKQELLNTIQADRVIDFSARYRVCDANGAEVCTAKQFGWKSLWQTRFDILEGDRVVFRLREDNPWTRMGDALLGWIPLGDLFSGLFFHPSYSISRVNSDGTDGELVLRIAKKRSFVERYFVIGKYGELSECEESEVLMTALMMVLLERRRG
ncbi:MAG: hypothetical protein BWY68_00596 [bacterium ADurb.Bin400]|nr:MAG: hypothetical protein BWY68_00596 [bacterium ADurb.Bin400]